MLNRESERPTGGCTPPTISSARPSPGRHSDLAGEMYGTRS